ncbi:serine beta-lactamase-like protein LACTB, mitochondrial isoform X2 [Alosa sapidissima]|uniref:serine beta-lactamase-like protein LACTB, mitochondrial isoform X2 n=1 Tax=Alosa sapidissima TaxID=34773 RepID=UPI001C08214D|nr:serine beta-lactamase-like protein LACTB, mitochondrial isoform X2 [Alosa sapidissima]
MSRVLLLTLERVHVRCKDCPGRFRSYPLLTSRTNYSGKLFKGVLYQQPTRPYTGFKRQSVYQSFTKTRSKLWVLGLGAGFVLAFGLKHHAYNSESCNAETPYEPQTDLKYAEAIEISRDLVRRIKDEVGAPGMVIGVSVDGVQVWTEGMGYADLENRVPCGPATVMRIASISKPLTAAAAARLWEEGKLDLDAPVQKYVPEFPEKTFEGEAVTITPRLILSHLSGIRHYEKDAKKVREDKEKAKRLIKLPERNEKEEKNSAVSKEKAKAEDDRTSKTKEDKKKKEFEQEEYYLKDRFENVIQALDLFKNDPLIYKPGTTFLYSTHAFCLLSAVVERVAGQRFLDHMAKMFRELGMLNTVPDENDPIIYHRSRNYHLNKKGRVVNCPYVDNSYKWAGGGFLSTAGDLLLFGNALLYSYQLASLQDPSGRLPGFLKPHTAMALWSPVDKTEASWDKDGLYAQGWLVVEKLQKYGQCRSRRHYVSHTGGAVGASSVLLVLPSEFNGEADAGTRAQGQTLPQGVVVTIITNMQSVGLNTTALKIALEFDKTRSK